jgi:hypothetical protein
MTVYDFLDLCIDKGMLTVELYSIDKGETVWEGYGDDIPEEYEYAELGSFDIPSKADRMTLNID